MLSASRRVVVFNLSIDDVHPETSAQIAECGGSLEEGPIGGLLGLAEEFPGLRITLFVTPNWIDKPDDPRLLRRFKRLLGLRYSNSWSGEPFRLDKHPEWCRRLEDLRLKGVFEIGVHGLYHHNPDSYLTHHSAEFHGLPYGECSRRIEEAERIFSRAGLGFSRVFRPPGWGVSRGLLEALKRLGYALSCKASSYAPGVLGGVVNVPPNWNIGEDPIERGVYLAERYGVVVAYGHIEPGYGWERLVDGVTAGNLERVRRLLRRLDEEFEVEYMSIEDISLLPGLEV